MQAIDGSLIYQILRDGSIFGGDYDGRLGPLTDWVNCNPYLFKGKSILDLGSNAGHFPIEYVRAGASKVWAVEGRSEFEDQWKLFHVELPVDCSRVEWQTADVRDYTNDRAEVVSCLGLLYHVGGFIPRLYDLSKNANIVLVEIQISNGPPKMRIETPDNRTMSLKDEQVVDFDSNMWERLLFARFGHEFLISRVWLLAYGEVYNVKRGQQVGCEVNLTARAFYVLRRNGFEVDIMVDQKTGCVDITDQKIRVYDETES